MLKFILSGLAAASAASLALAGETVVLYQNSLTPIVHLCQRNFSIVIGAETHAQVILPPDAVGISYTVHSWQREGGMPGATAYLAVNGANSDVAFPGDEDAGRGRGTPNFRAGANGLYIFGGNATEIFRLNLRGGFHTRYLCK